MKQGWEIKRLDDIIESNVIGLTKNSSEQDTNHKFKYVKMNNITRDNRFDLSKYTCVDATKLEAEKYSLSYGDFLFNTRNSYELVGKTCLFEGFNNEVILYNNNIMRIRFIKNINPFFINYSFSTDDLIKKIDRLKSGTTNVSAIYYKDLKNLELSVPPLPEQQRIVAILDEAFEAIAKAKANAEQNLKNVKELFESYLQGVFENPNNYWEKKKLVEICGFVRGPFGGSLKKNIFKPDGYAVYEQQHAIYDQFDDLRYFIDEKKFNEMKRFELNSGDLIMSCSGTMGKIAIVPENIKKGIINQALLKLSPSKKVSNIFLKLWMQSESFQNSLKEYAGGAAIQNVASVAILKNIEIPLPDISIQNNIVEKVLLFSSETKKLEANYQQKINDLEELKKSVLQKAFNGELKEKK